MVRLIAIAAAVVALAVSSQVAEARPKPDPWPGVTYGPHHPWIRYWNARERQNALALKTAAGIFGVKYRWLRTCNLHEGGDRMVWNHEGSKAFGPMQFMSGTFWAHVHRAFSAAKARRRPVPFRFKRWDSYVGQAVTAAWMFATGRSYHWSGYGC